ncbi:hypothetical protein EDD18DRAFT_73911 [Armillaria luteobubalina]|uniref:Uncharacterized protein n=1 Tax=Armillaria luteobubalina TaxID=153913 RepID=A0AA39U585_9AGAR|nr:hypothetical protein EDD18DRAFT_73911 [Armillaria luteobubalina]
MSSAAPLLIRGRCVEHTDNVLCQCSYFIPHRDLLQWHTLDQSRCVCGHGIHAHADYFSPVVHHCPATSCVAYVQKMPQTQECMCMALLVDHKAVVNLYRTAATFTNNREHFVSGAQGIVSSQSVNTNPSTHTLIPVSSPNANALPRNQPGSTQAEASVVVAHHLPRYISDDSAPNGTFDYHPNAVYDATPEAGAWAQSYA